MSGRERRPPTRALQEPQLPNPYEPFVRNVLTRLADELGAGRLNLRREDNGVRYVVEAPGHSGRNIVVPAAHGALEMPTKFPARTAKGLLSKLTVVDASGKVVHVPKSAIVRNYDYCIHEREFGMRAGVCRGCEFGTCPHGWKAEQINPVGVVVLELRDEDYEPAHAWYVRFADAPTRLVRLPEVIVDKISTIMSLDPELQHSSLMGRYADDLANGFHELACERFARFRKRAAAAATKDRKRKCPEASPATGGGETCIICLEEQVTARKRCRHDHCGTYVCDTCHSDSRGLCPVCDRSSINADYPCSSCHKLTRLSQYGFPCTACNSRSLCSDCYTGFSACGACESM